MHALVGFMRGGAMIQAMSFAPVPPEEQSCRNCYYARPSDRGRAWKVSCRVHPPHQAGNFATETFEPLWPQVEVGEWCGHWHPASKVTREGSDDIPAQHKSLASDSCEADQ